MCFLAISIRDRNLVQKYPGFMVRKQVPWCCYVLLVTSRCKYSLKIPICCSSSWQTTLVVHIENKQCICLCFPSSYHLLDYVTIFAKKWKLYDYTHNNMHFQRIYWYQWYVYWKFGSVVSNWLIHKLFVNGVLYLLAKAQVSNTLKFGVSFTVPETNSKTTWNRPGPKKTIASPNSQPFIFRGKLAVSFKERRADERSKFPSSIQTVKDTVSSVLYRTIPKPCLGRKTSPVKRDIFTIDPTEFQKNWHLIHQGLGWCHVDSNALMIGSQNLKARVQDVSGQVEVRSSNWWWCAFKLANRVAHVVHVVNVKECIYEPFWGTLPLPTSVRVQLKIDHFRTPKRSLLWKSLGQESSLADGKQLLFRGMMNGG